MKHKAVGIAVFVLIVIMLGSLIYFDPSLLAGIKPNTVLSMSNVSLATQGATISNEGAVTGAYWDAVISVNSVASLQGYLLPNGTAAPITSNGVQQEAATTASVEIDVTPMQPYMMRDLQVASAQEVTPKAIGTTGSAVNPLMMQYDQWNGPWQIFTPYEVSVLVNGHPVGTPIILDTNGLPSNSTSGLVPTSDGDILITNLGGLQQQYYGPPQLPSDICLLPTGAGSTSGFLYNWDQISTMLSCQNPGAIAGAGATKYSDYWFGTQRNPSNEATNTPIMIGTMEGSTFQPSLYGGWEGSNSGGSVKAVQPVVYPFQVPTLGSGAQATDKESFMTVTEWLQSQNVANYANPNGLAGNVFAIYGHSWSVQTDPATGSLAMVVDIPMNGYVTPTVDVAIPSALADTWVSVNKISDVAVSAHWDSTGSNSELEFSSQALLDVVCTQKSTVTSTADITASCTDSRFQVYPTSIPVNLAPGASKTIQFTVTQSGGTTTDNGPSGNGVTITIGSYETYTNQLMEHCTILCSFLPTTGSDTTSLTVLVEDNSAQHTPLSGVPLFIEYPTTAGATQTGYTGSDGTASYNLGTYTGQVYIEAGPTAATSSEPAFSMQHLVTTVKYGPNPVTIIMGAKKASSINWLLIALIAVIIAIIIVCSYVVYYVTKHSGSKRSRKH